MVQGWEFRVLDFKVCGSGRGVLGLEFNVCGALFRVWGLKFDVCGAGFRVWGKREYALRTAALCRPCTMIRLVRPLTKIAASVNFFPRTVTFLQRPDLGSFYKEFEYEGSKCKCLIWCFSKLTTHLSSRVRHCFYAAPVTHNTRSRARMYRMDTFVVCNSGQNAARAQMTSA